MSSLTVYSGNGGDIISSDATYTVARAGSGFLLAHVGNTVSLGQDPSISCWEFFCDFDTSSLGSGATVTAVVFSLYVEADHSTTDFTATAAVSNWGASLTTTDFIAGASLSALTTVATLATSGVTASAYNDFANVAFPANVSKTSNTRILIYSSRQSSGNQPAGSEYLDVSNYGATNKPRLTITYTTGTGGSSQTAQMMS